MRDLAREIIDLVRRKTGHKNILFLIDEAGQYVAPRGELILNLDGLARNLKELGKGKVWIAATGQQTLTEIVEKAAHNSAELNKLRDRFPISIHLDASDIREITYRRLLDEVRRRRGSSLKRCSRRTGGAHCTHTRLSGTALFKGDPDADDVRPSVSVPAAAFRSAPGTHPDAGPFDRRHRAAFGHPRDPGRAGGQEPRARRRRVKLADRDVGTLACVDDFYDTLRADIAKVLPHVIAGVDKVIRSSPDDTLRLRVAKAVAALQPVETFPRTAENIAALLYRQLGRPHCSTKSGGSARDRRREGVRPHRGSAGGRLSCS